MSQRVNVLSDDLEKQRDMWGSSSLIAATILIWVSLCQTEPQCFKNEEASWEIKKWILTEIGDEDKTKVRFYETDMSFVKPDSGPSWYIVGDGWQGSYYYEDGHDLVERPGVYLYPDYFTAVRGLYRDHVLVTGQVTRLSEACRDGHVWSLSFEKIEPSQPPLTYSPPSHYSYGVSPTFSDPYETRTVEVKRSVKEDANQGLFTRRSVMSGEVLAFYSGLIINCDSSLRPLDRRELSDAEEHDRNAYNIALDLGGDEENLCIDIPPDMGGDVRRYNATLAHKVNHSFEPNSEFVLFSAHPVLGTIMAITALEDLEAGLEVTVNYGYNFTAEPDQPEWFRQLWIDYYGDQEEKNDIINEHQEL